MEAGRRNQSGNRDSQSAARDPNRRVTVMKATEYDAGAADTKNKPSKDGAVSGGHH